MSHAPALAGSSCSQTTSAALGYDAIISANAHTSLQRIEVVRRAAKARSVRSAWRIADHVDVDFAAAQMMRRTASRSAGRDHR